MSLLQKAIRRNNQDFAILAAARLQRFNPNILRKRISVICFEDIGCANPNLLNVCGEALKSNAFWQDETAANDLVGHMCESPKCRAVDDLLLVAEWHPDLANEIGRVATFDVSQMWSSMRQPNSVESRCLLLRHAFGEMQIGGSAVPRRESWSKDLAFDMLRELGCGDFDISLAKIGQASGSGAMGAIYALLRLSMSSASPIVTPDAMPSEGLVSGIPGWAYDIHVREGNRAIAAFLQTKAASARMIKQAVPVREQRLLLGSLLFRTESGLVQQRLQWELGNRLRHSADTEVHEIHPSLIVPISQQLTRDIPLLNEVRQYVIKSYPR